MKPQFFIDTASVGVVKQVWEKLNKFVESEALLGVTTNPSALDKVNCVNLKDLETVVLDLANALYDINPDATIFVQIPNSIMWPEDVLKWGTYISGLGDGIINMGVKIPHWFYMLELHQDLA